jgi:predicted Zn-dependent peptidase
LPRDVIEMVRGAFGGEGDEDAGPLVPQAFPSVREEKVVTESLGEVQGAVLMGKVINEVSEHDRSVLQIAASVVNAALFRNLREMRGLAYSLGASADFLGNQGTIKVWVHTARDKVVETGEALLEELSRLREVAVDREEVDRRANFRLGRLRIRMLSSMNRAYYLGLADLRGETHSFGERYERMLQRVTPQEIQQAIREHFEPRNYIMVLVD